MGKERAIAVPEVLQKLLKFEFHARIAIDIFVQLVEHLCRLDWCFYSDARPFAIVLDGVIDANNISVLHLTRRRNDGENIGDELAFVSTDNLECKQAGILHESFKDSCLLSRPFISVQCVALVVVFGIRHIVQGRRSDANIGFTADGVFPYESSSSIFDYMPRRLGWQGFL